MKKKNLRATAGSIAAIGLLLAAFHGGGIGGCGGEASEDLRPPQEDFRLIGASESSFNSIVDPVTLETTSAALSNETGYFSVFNNDKLIPEKSIKVSGNRVIISSILQEGRNNIELYAMDAQGENLSQEVTLWAGREEIKVRVVDENQNPINGADVFLKLGDDSHVQAKKSSQSGEVVFSNIPRRTVFLEARTSDNKLATLPTTGISKTVTLTLKGFKKPTSDVNRNLSFVDGLEGWDVGAAPVKLIPHVEPSGLPAGLSATDPSQKQMDLQLGTGGEGPQSISKTFKPSPGTKSVAVRYRFITSEVPGGFFGTQFNDYFSVSIRSENGGGQVTESNSMNGLGLGAFDASGATDWRETSLKVGKEGDTVQIDMTVANVADGKYPSSVVVDLVEEKKMEITNLELKDIDNSTLGLLSVGSHTYFNGNTRVNGTITVVGEEKDALKSLTLEVLQGGQVVATGELAPDAKSALLRSFGQEKKVELTTSQLFFLLSGDGMGKIKMDQDGSLSLRVRAQSQEGAVSVKEYGSVQLLVRYPGSNRFSVRDEDQGGDDWVKPNVKKVVEHFASSITVNDMSNMNGGFFVGHKSHTTGVDVDAKFPGYDVRNEKTAQTMISLLNDSTFGSKIRTVFVAYKEDDSDPFWKAIKDVNLNDERKVKDVIRPDSKHKTHFHWRVVN